MSSTISIRLPREVEQLLDKVARETGRSRSFHVRMAVRRYLEEFADAQVALDRLRDKDDPAITAKEIRGAIGL